MSVDPSQAFEPKHDSSLCWKWHASQQVKVLGREFLDHNSRINAMLAVETREDAKTLLKDLRQMRALLRSFQAFCLINFPVPHNPSPLDDQVDHVIYNFSPKEFDRSVNAARRIIPFTSPILADCKLQKSTNELGFEYDDPCRHIVEQPKLFLIDKPVSSFLIYLEWVFRGKDRFQFRKHEYHLRRALSDLDQIDDDLWQRRTIRKLFYTDPESADTLNRFVRE